MAVMSARKSRRSTRKPREPSMDSRKDVGLIIQDHLIQFMGRRFPEFCALRAACRVSVRASPFAKGDYRVASYQAAIDSVGARHYTHWPFMVEVLNKWLETNQDFVRDPLGFIASNPLPAPVPTTGMDCSTPTPTPTQDTPSRTTSTTSSLARTQSSPTVADNPTLSSSCDPEASDRNVDSSPVASTTGIEPNEWDSPPTPLNGDTVPIPIRNVLPLSWINAFHFPPSLRNLGNITTTTSWFRHFFLSSCYERWWDALRKSFTFRRG